MDSRFMVFAGPAPEGADVLRERLPWTVAERRWQEHRRVFRDATTLLPSGQAALRCGAQPTRFKDPASGGTGNLGTPLGVQVGSASALVEVNATEKDCRCSSNNSGKNPSAFRQWLAGPGSDLKNS
ncbi:MULTISPECIES: hypothetical protein [Azospirillum]|uniref:hypothetical protein n=1 Tax=Azospirillum TaxID=191 RepID=UPI00157ABA67|nr:MULTISPECIES: hypothetical protein [Azospirillum]MBB3268350.1 hypothetical protein [Azospirillum sp. OGB3]UKJ78191.1 hypothetical protein H1Q64_33310 [Azospirillum brasilense]